MIFTDRIITVRKGESKINEPIIVYRGDYELEVRFTIMNSKFKFMSGINLIESENAAYGQLAILTPYGGNIFSDVAKCNEGSVTFVLTTAMLDQIEEVGLYSFQIRLFDYNKESRVSIPPVEFGIEVREPISSEDHDNSVNNAIVGYSIAKIADALNEEVPDTFNSNGDYNKTIWETGDRITEGKLNKIEDAIDTINQNEINDKNTLNKQMTSNFNVLQNQIDNIVIESGNTDAEVEQARGAYNLLNQRLNAMDETDAELISQLAQNTENIETREVNILVEDDYDVEDISIVVNRLSTELYNKGGGIIFIPAGTYYIKSPIILEECVSMVGVANPYSYYGNTDKIGTTIIKNGTFADFAIRLVNSSKLTNLGLTNISDSEGSGVQIYGNKCCVENVTISKFTNDGLQVGDMITKRNCNNWSLQNVNCLKNSGRGFVIDTVYDGAGPDTNAGLALKCSAWGNGSDGYYLGDSAVNTFLQCYSESNATVGWRITRNSKRNLLLGCGSEQNTEEQFLFEEGSSNNMYLGQAEFGPDSSGNNIFIRNNGGTVQKLQVSHPVYSGVESSAFTPGITGGFVSCGNIPGYVWYETDGVAGMKCFDIILNAGAFQYRLSSDNGASPNTYMRTTKNATSGILHSFNCNIASSKMESATTLGSLIKKLPIYNYDGSLAGYIPVYLNIE